VVECGICIGKGLVVNFVRGGALYPDGLQTGGPGMPFNRRSSCSILFFSRRSFSHYHVKWQISSLPSLPFRVSSARSFQSLFPNLSPFFPNISHDFPILSLPLHPLSHRFYAHLGSGFSSSRIQLVLVAVVRLSGVPV